MKYWGMVDYYNGGMEHATRHLYMRDSGIDFI